MLALARAYADLGMHIMEDAVDGAEFLGLITRMDLLNWLRRRKDSK